jgi:hypothetical protein
VNQHVNMANFIAPKSDQLNSDDLIGGPITIRVTAVAANEGSPEQPISISFEGDDGKPYKPCKSMRRVMVHIWGSDANKYVGRGMTLYRDPKVQFGGMQVGGIRISHMSDIPDDKLGDGKVQMALTASKAKRAPYIVRPLQLEQRQATPASPNAAEKWATDHIGFVVGAVDLDRLAAIQASGKKAMDKLASQNPELHAKVTAAYEAKHAELAGDDDTFASDPEDPFSGGPEGDGAGGEEG